MALIKRNTAYSLNDIVNTTFGTKLKCTTAGTTSTDPLILDGTSPITDGTVVWEIQEESGSASFTTLCTCQQSQISSGTTLTLSDDYTNYDLVQVAVSNGTTLKGYNVFHPADNNSVQIFFNESSSTDMITLGLNFNGSSATFSFASLGGYTNLVLRIYGIKIM